MRGLPNGKGIDEEVRVLDEQGMVVSLAVDDQPEFEVLQIDCERFQETEECKYWVKRRRKRGYSRLRLERWRRKMVSKRFRRRCYSGICVLQQECA